MIKRLLISLSITGMALFASAQNEQPTEAGAMALVQKNIAATGLSKADFANSRISSAYTDASSGITYIYLQQTWKGIDVFGKMLTLAFKNEQLSSKAGQFIGNMQTITRRASASFAVQPSKAVQTAYKGLALTAPALPVPEAKNKGHWLDYGKVAGGSENLTAELLWFPIEKETLEAVKLVWQVQVSPSHKDDVWHIRIDAQKNTILSKVNVVVTEQFQMMQCVNASDEQFKKKTPLPRTNETGTHNLNPTAIANANYLVVPYPLEAPSFGVAATRSNPWTAAPGNASTLGWHSDGTTDYTISRGNNVWATEDTIATNTNSGLAASSSTSPDPLNFVNPPNYLVEPSRDATMQQFCITNLFYWNNIIHDITYQYGFDEPAGNFQVNNQGRGGAGNDYVIALAQSGAAGHIGNNANFLTPADGGRGRMRMYLFNAVGTTTLNVNSPAPVSGNYTAVEGTFSTNNLLANVGPVTGQVVYYNDDAAGTTHFACNPPVNSVAGKIALIDRGFGGAICTATVAFTLKVKNAQNAGAIGVIVVNNIAGAPTVMGGTDNTITIPAVMISQTDGAIFAAQLVNNLNVTLSGTPAVVKDGDLDNGIITHEFTHGLSNRLTGGPANSSCLQNAEQGGEGWSDYVSLMLTTNWATATTGDGPIGHGIGTYVLGQSTNGPGIRTYKYSTDLAINPLTYANMGVAPIGTEVHNIGEIWCAALWEMTWGIIQQENAINPNMYNFSLSNNGGNSIALKLVLEGMKLQPCSPGFIDARNAILTADKNLYNGRHQCAIWTAFAKRGMGYSALQGSSASATDQTAATNLPPAPTITGQPVDVTVTVGANASFTVTPTPAVNGAYLFYKWQVSTNGGATWTDLSPAVTTATLTLTGVAQSMNGNKYRCIITQGCAVSNSNAATLTVNPAAGFTFGTPTNASVNCNSTPATMTTTVPLVSVGGFSNPVTLTATAGVPAGTTVTFSPPTPAPGTTVTVSLNNANTLAAGTYTITIQGIATGAPTQTVNVVYTITPGTGPSFNIQPGGQILCENLNAIFTSAASSGTYQWQVSTNGGASFSNIPGATNATLTLVSVTASMNNNQYRCNASTLCGSTSSNAATLTVNAAPVVTTHPANVALCTGSSNTFSIAATGSNITYQWQLSTNGCSGPWSNINLATNSSLTLSGITAGQNNTGYRCVVSGACAPIATSNCALLTVTASPNITSHPGNQIACEGTTASFTTTVSGTGVIYQWQVSTNGGASFTNISSANAATLNLTNVTPALNNNQYRCVVSTSLCTTTSTSNAAILSINTLPAITAAPQNITLCTGSSGNFNITASGTGILYQWQLSTDGGATFNNIAGANASGYTVLSVTVAMNNNRYRCVVSGTCTPAAQSVAAVLTVNAPVTVIAQPVNTEVCSGGNANFSVTGTSVPAIIYQWQVSTDGGASYNNITGATNATLSLNNVITASNNNRYRCQLSNAVCPTPATSGAGVLIVRLNPVVTLTQAPLLTTLIPGQTTVLTATASSGTGGTFSSQWLYNSTPLSVVGNSYLVDVQHPGSYQVRLQETWPGGLVCSANSQVVTIGVGISRKLFIFPSPNDGNFQVTYFNDGGTSTRRSITIFDDKGALVYKKQFDISGVYTLLQVNLTHVAAGIYFVRIHDAAGTQLAEGNVRVR
jgi:extracellular elastinolytic metalloproteinase